jgi:hypothetical protein
MALNLLPEELLELILEYYSFSVQGMLLFSSINRYCKLFIDHSHLWSEVNLHFIPRKEYLLTFHPKDYCEKLASLHNGEPLIFQSSPMYQHLQKYSMVCFHNELRFPFAYQVQVQRPRKSTPLLSLDASPKRNISRTKSEERFHTKQFRDWYVALFMNYQRLWHQQARVRPNLKKWQSFLQYYMDKYLWNGILSLGVIFLLCASYCFRSFDIKKFHSSFSSDPLNDNYLADQQSYNRGFYFLYGYLSTFVVLHLFTILIDFLSSLLNMKKTLKFLPVIASFITLQLRPFYFFLLIIFTILLSIQCIQWSLQSQQITFLWSMTTVPLMIFFLLMIRSHWKLFLQQNNIIFNNTNNNAGTSSWWSLAAAATTSSQQPVFNPNNNSENSNANDNSNNNNNLHSASYMHGIDYTLLSLCCLFIFYCLLYDLSKDMITATIFYKPLAYFTFLFFSPFIVIILCLTIWKFYQSFVFWNQYVFGKCDNIYWINYQQKSPTQLFGNICGLLSAWGMCYMMFLWLMVSFFPGTNNNGGTAFLYALRVEHPIESMYFMVDDWYGDQSRNTTGLSSISIGLLMISCIQSFIVFTSLEG